nr:hypothetical protein [uncultured Rhodococcus sp.]
MSESLARREAEVTARERQVQWAIGEIKAVLAVLEHGQKFPMTDGSGLTKRSQERMDRWAAERARGRRQ